MIKWNAALALGLAATGSVVSVSAAQAQASAFPDVPQNHWAYDAVTSLANKGLVKGYTNGEFLGKRTLTRYEFATVINRMLDAVSDMIKAQQAGAQPAAPAVTQDDLNKIQVLVDKFQPELDTIQADVKAAQDNLDALRQDVLDTKETAQKALNTSKAAYSSDPKSKFSISGYIQSRYTVADSDNQARFPHGTPAANSAYNGNYMQGGNSASFLVRRARIKFTGAVTSNTKYAIQLDASGVANPAISVAAATSKGNISSSAFPVSVREANVAYTFGDGTAANPTLTMGLFANPFGYMIGASAAGILTPEKPLGFNEGGAGIFANVDYDRGVQLQLPRGSMKYTVAVTDGTGLVSNATSRQFDQTYRAAYQSSDKKLGLGVSYVRGELKSFLGAHKELTGVDAQYVSPAGPFILAEYENGKYEQRSYFATPADVALTTAKALGNKIEAYYVQGGYTAHAASNHAFTVGASYDVLKRSKSGAVGSGSSFDDVNLGYGAAYNLDKAARLRVWYVKPTSVAHLVGTVSPPKYGLLTSEIQVRF